MHVDHGHAVHGAGQVGDQQPQRVGAAVDRPDPAGGRSQLGHRGAPAGRSAHGGAAAGVVGEQPNRLVAQWVDPGADRERVRDQDVQAFHPGRHPAGADRRAEVVQRVALGEVRLVGRQVAGGQLRFGGQPRVHLRHHAGRLHPGHDGVSAEQLR